MPTTNSQYKAIRGIPHEDPNPSFEPKSKFLRNHRHSKFLRNSQQLLPFQVVRFLDFNIPKWGHGISIFLFYEIKISPNQNFHQDSILYMRLMASLMCLQRITCIKYTMNVPELKLLSSSSSIDSISMLEEEADEDEDGDEEGRNTGNSSKSKTNSSSTDDTEEEQKQEISSTQQEKLKEHHAKNIFNSTMGGKDLCVLFVMAIGCHSRDIPDHKEPPFSQSKVYHSEVKPDASTLKLEVTQCWKAYMKSRRQPRPSNWKIDKCIEYLMENPIPTTEIYDLDWIESEIKESKGIQEMVNESQQREDDRILHHTWSTDILYLCLYHTLIEENIRLSLGEAFAMKTRKQLDGRNSNLFKSFYEKAADRFNDASWIPNSLVIPDLHEDFNRSRPLPLNVAPISPEQFKKNYWTIDMKWLK